MNISNTLKKISLILLILLIEFFIFKEISLFHAAHGAGLILAIGIMIATAITCLIFIKRFN
jgi:hypothetical protein